VGRSCSGAVGQVLTIAVEEGHLTKPKDAVARIEGFVIDIENGADFVGQGVELEITKVLRTHAKARVLKKT
jgi:ribonuclease G